MNKLPLLVLSFSLAIKCGEPLPERIAGGIKAEPGQFPYFAQLQTTDRPGAKSFTACGASLIRPNWILTAAHCFPFKINFVKVFMGTNIRYDNYAYINNVVQLFIHPRYYIIDRTPIMNDIAVARLKKPYFVNEYVQTALLPPPATIGQQWTSRCTFGTIMGVGLKRPSEENEELTSDHFSKYVMYARVQSKKLDELSIPFIEPIVDTVFYTENQWTKGHSLGGDSGGPFVCDYNGRPVLYGVLSKGTYNATMHDTSIDTYEEIDKHMEFISSKVQGLQIYEEEAKKRAEFQVAESKSDTISSSAFCIFILYVCSKRTFELNL